MSVVHKQLKGGGTDDGAAKPQSTEHPQEDRDGDLSAHIEAMERLLDAQEAEQERVRSLINQVNKALEAAETTPTKPDGAPNASDRPAEPPAGKERSLISQARSA